MRSEKSYGRVLVWMRRALHIQDNLPLWSALRDAHEVIPVLVLGTHPRYMVDTPRRRFIRQAIQDLDRSLRGMGSRLVIAVGDPVDALPALAVRCAADAVFAARVYDPRLSGREQRIGESLRTQGIKYETFKESVLFEADEIANAEGNPYRIYTPFMRVVRMREREMPPVLPLIRSIPRHGVDGAQLSQIPGFERKGARAGESEARSRLRAFLAARVLQYAKDRDFPAVDGTSRLSADLGLGTISVRTVYHAAMKKRDAVGGRARTGIETFMKELIWREFYYHIVMHFPEVIDHSFREEFRAMAWRSDARKFEAWRTGRTGYPIVDAAMRQLVSEGWMHNRARMIVASFLTKDLHIDWRQGERHFLDHLVDADVASNNGGWQWTAGTGTDASPYFRIFNPVQQAKRFDPDGEYVRRYVPELAGVKGGAVHEPWRLSREDQRLSHCLIGRDYPEPIVDHGKEREVALKMYQVSRGVPGRRS